LLNLCVALFTTSVIAAVLSVKLTANNSTETIAVPSGTKVDIAWSAAGGYTPYTCINNDDAKGGTGGTGNYSYIATVSKTIKVTCTDTATNGSCNNTVNNSCTTGVLSDTSDSAENYLWSCLGINGGTSDTTCSYPRPQGNPVVSGCFFTNNLYAKNPYTSITTGARLFLDRYLLEPINTTRVGNEMGEVFNVTDGNLVGTSTGDIC